jgi:toxin YoeB
MGKYKIALTDRAKVHLSEWKKSGQLIALKKIERIFIELSTTPFSGIGSPELR